MPTPPLAGCLRHLTASDRHYREYAHEARHLSSATAVHLQCLRRRLIRQASKGIRGLVADTGEAFVRCRNSREAMTTRWTHPPRSALGNMRELRVHHSAKKDSIEQGRTSVFSAEEWDSGEGSGQSRLGSWRDRSHGAQLSECLSHGPVLQR